MMHISPMAPTRRQRLARWADAVAGVLILAGIGLLAGIAGGSIVLLAARGLA